MFMQLEPRKILILLILLVVRSSLLYVHIQDPISECS